MPKVEISENLNRIRKRIATSCSACARDPQSVTLLAVSKSRPAQDLRTAFAWGQQHFGENYVQEAVEKQAQLADLDICWHFIGPLQANKTRVVAEQFHWLHSLERLKIAQRLSTQRKHSMPPLNVCLQVNIDNEPSKSGVNADNLTTLAKAVAALPNLRLRGLMALPAPQQDATAQSQPFLRLAQLLTQLRTQLPQHPWDTLSMGMSADMELAIACGATTVRIGTDIFGPRQAQHDLLRS